MGIPRLESLSHLIVYSCVQVFLVHSSVGWADGNAVANDVVVVMVTCHVVTGDLLSIASTDSDEVPPISRQMEVQIPRSGQQQIALGVVNIS
jgi:hypothetical protein